MTTPALEDPSSTALDLSSVSVDEHWQKLGLHKAIRAMEACEPWVIDAAGKCNVDAEHIIAELASRLACAKPDSVARSVAQAPGDIVDLIGYLRSGRALVLFKWLSELHPAIASTIIQEARFGGNDFGVVLLDRINTLQKQHMLYRVFSSDRMGLVLRILEDAGLSSIKGDGQ